MQQKWIENMQVQQAGRAYVRGPLGDITVLHQVAASVVQGLMNSMAFSICSRRSVARQPWTPPGASYCKQVHLPPPHPNPTPLKALTGSLSNGHSPPPSLASRAEHSRHTSTCLQGRNTTQRARSKQMMHVLFWPPPGVLAAGVAAAAGAGCGALALGGVIAGCCWAGCAGAAGGKSNG